MEKLLGNKKRVFWEALFLTIVVFLFGLLIGISFESGKINDIKSYYSYSEISMMDIFASNNLFEMGEIDCADLKKVNFDFADRVYNEAVLLEKYEEAGKVNDNLILEHKKYDLLRTFLWINEIKYSEVCGRDFHSFVYLYEYQPEDLAQKATQNVWSKILVDLKSKHGEEVLLIPVAVDSDLVSLNSLIKGYNLTDYPVLIVDDKEVIEELLSVEQLEEYIN